MIFALMLGISLLAVAVVLFKSQDRYERPALTVTPVETTPATATAPLDTGTTVAVSALPSAAVSAVSTASATPLLTTSTATVTATAIPLATATHRRPNPSSSGTGKTPTTAPTGEPDEPPGFLTLQPYPWMKVSEGAKSLGTTPLIKVPLAPGTHTLTLENPEKGIKKTYTVTIKSGETLARSPAYE